MPAVVPNTGPAGVLRSPQGGGVSGFAGPVGPPRPAFKVTQVVSKFQSGHGWGQSGANGTLADDTGEYLFGTQSLKLTSDGAGAGYCSARKTGISPTFDMDQNNLRVWLRVTNGSAISQLLVYVSSTNFGSSVNASGDIKPVGTYCHLRDGEWACLVIGKEQLASYGAGGAPVWSAINSMQISVLDNSTAQAIVHVGSIEVVPRPDTSYVSFCFDDGFAEVYTKARPLMDAYGYTGTVFIIADIIDSSGFMTMAQLKKLETAGWEVAAHSATLAQHNQTRGLLDCDTAGFRSNLLTQRQWLWGNGFRGTGIAYPRGAHDATMREEVRKVYSYARSVLASGGPESFPPADPYQLRSHEIYQATSTATVDTWVQTAVNGNRWAILEFHGIKDTPDVGNDFQFSTAKFTTVCANVAALSGVTVLPMGDVMAEWVRAR